MSCSHTYIRINDTTKPRDNQGASWNGMIAGAVAGCIHCGEIRAVYEDGTVKLLKEGTEHGSN